MKKNKQELILKVGAMGGSISVWSVNAKDGTRTFVVKTDESTLKDFMDEEDAEGISFKSETERLHSFADALVALGSYPWHELYPMFVHQDFVDPVLVAVKELGGGKNRNPLATETEWWFLRAFYLAVQKDIFRNLSNICDYTN